ncbi:AraC family transcriptional regulator [Micromonospora sp. WMMD1082]|uniref:helix-turn-helix transcriptional regulator n=1 Tax=Micromonospora sp. WMMD1082 TaxID=3016104 RepID=UPI002416DE19|nr:AraC family transcriptional regulator [Micromonospora sp. WMMD1082]MDG4798271.1 AraC family transcriptional regulator [Micromonospora sp. WMMD1082]
MHLPERAQPMRRNAGTALEMRAWRPRLPGVAEVLHAHVTGHAYPMHAHDTWTLLIVDDGAVRYDLHRHERLASRDLVTLLPPHVPHNGCPAGPDGFRKRVIYLDASHLAVDLIGSSVGTSSFTDPWLRRALSALHGVLRQPGDELRAEGLLALLVDRVRVHLGERAVAAPRDHTAAYLLRDLLEQHVADGVSLYDAGRLLHFHPSYLVRTFHREFGTTPHRYLTSRRVDHARRLILDGQPLASVARSSGFYDQPHLTRHFTRILGVSPGLFSRAARSTG